MLAPEFNKYGFHFKELVSDGIYKIYEKTKGNYKGYEVCRTRFYDGYEIAGVFIEPAQSMPGNEEWGINGFSLLTLEDAKQKLEWMKNVQFKETQETQETKEIKEIGFNIPPGEFDTKKLAELNGITYIKASKWIKENLGKKIKFIREESGGRGKPKKFYKSKEQ